MNVAINISGWRCIQLITRSLVIVLDLESLHRPLSVLVCMFTYLSTFVHQMQHLLLRIKGHSSCYTTSLHLFRCAAQRTGVSHNALTNDDFRPRLRRRLGQEAQAPAGDLTALRLYVDRERHAAWDAPEHESRFSLTQSSSSRGAVSHRCDAQGLSDVTLKG